MSQIRLHGVRAKNPQRILNNSFVGFLHEQDLAHVPDQFTMG